jgi:hypothetical protein
MTFDGAVGHFDRCLIIGSRIPARTCRRPLLCVGHGALRQSLVVQVREHRERNQSERSIATGGRSPRDEVLPDVGGHHDAPGAQSHVDRVAQRRQEIRQSRLAHPVAQIQGIAAVHQQDVGLLDHRHPMVLIDAGQRGELQHSQRLPTQFAHGGPGLSSGDEVPCQAGAALHAVSSGRDTEGTRLCDRFAQEVDQRVPDARVLDARGSEKQPHDSRR